MDKSIFKAALGAAAFCMISASSTMAADILLKMDASGNSVSVTNTLPANLTMLSLTDQAGNSLPLFVRLAAKSTVKAPLRFVMPDRLSEAVCEFGDQQRRHLSVDIQ
jgi:hypothetical protein